MKHYVYFDSTGNVVGSTSSPDDAIPPAPAGLFALQVDRHYQPDSVYVHNGVVRAKPPRPGHAAKFVASSGSWVADVPAAWADVRAKRDKLISTSDWTALPDVPLTDDARAKWAQYRQALRDITSQPDPTKIAWPAPPG